MVVKCKPSLGVIYVTDMVEVKDNETAVLLKRVIFALTKPPAPKDNGQVLLKFFISVTYKVNPLLLFARLDTLQCCFRCNVRWFRRVYVLEYRYYLSHVSC